MKKRIVFATGNVGKMKEIKMILGDLGMPVVSMKEAGIEADIVEDGRETDAESGSERRWPGKEPYRRYHRCECLCKLVQNGLCSCSRCG